MSKMLAETMNCIISTMLPLQFGAEAADADRALAQAVVTKTMARHISGAFLPKGHNATGNPGIAALKVARAMLQHNKSTTPCDCSASDARAMHAHQGSTVDTFTCSRYVRFGVASRKRGIYVVTSPSKCYSQAGRL